MVLLLDGRFQRLFFLQGEKTVEIVDEDHPVLKFHYSTHMLHAGKDRIRRDDLSCRPFDDVICPVHHKGHGPFRRSGNDQVVAQPCSPLRKAEAAADIEDRHNISNHGDDAEDDLRRFRQGGDLDHADGPVDGGKMKRIALIVEGEDNEVTGFAHGTFALRW
ncbi:hypothetical protein PLCT2_02583 [Planctomycetaceae bacterium]|nr:hypothetical protein PLCT2_02583 [Planctomycetaceae bacterium]